MLLTAAGAAERKNKIRGAGNTAGPKAHRRILGGVVAEIEKAAVSAGRQPGTRRGSKEQSEESQSGEEVNDSKAVAEITETGGLVNGPKELLASGGKSKDAGNTSAVGNSGTGLVGTVSLKHIYEIARIKQSETRLAGLSMEGLCKSVIAQAGGIGVAVVP